MPDRPHANRGASFATLYEAPLPAGQARGGELPLDLRRYGARLAVPLRDDRPTVIVNFVESLDGVVTLDPAHGSGAEVSGFSEPDRFVMGLLRSLADAIVVGAGTMRAAANHTWTTGHVNRDFAKAYRSWRIASGLAPEPVTIVVTARGDIPGDHPAFRAPDVRPLVVTAPAAAARVRAAVPAGVRVVETAVDGDHIPASSILAVATAEGAALVLCEGGPHLTAAFVEERLMDELFLTVAPQLIGRRPASGERYSLVEGVTLDMESAPWGQLRSVRRSGDHLFLRYAFEGQPIDAQAGRRG